MAISPITVITSILIIAVVLAMIFFTVRHFVKYHAKLKGKKTDRQRELENMQIDDLG